MNWKLIFGLSLFGFIMAFAINFVPLNIELLCFLLLFIIYAYVIAKNVHGKYFLHGFVVSSLGCVWMTLTDLIFSSHYDPNPYWPAMVLVFAVALGAFSFIASKITRKTHSLNHTI